VRAGLVASAWRTPLGGTVPAAMARLFAGERAASTDARAGYACTAIAPVLDRPAPSRQARFLGRMGLLALEVAGEALKASGIVAGPRTGVFCGVGGLRAHWEDMLDAFAGQADDGTAMWERGLKDVHPYWMLRHLSNNVHALAAMSLGLKGDGATFGGANAGTQALASAIRALEDGALDAALVIGYDSLLEPETLVELAANRTVTTAPPNAVAAPYSVGASGCVPGEAAAAVVLVREVAAPRAWVSARVTAGADSLAACIAPLTGNGTFAAVNSPLAAVVSLIDGAARAWPELDRAERDVLAAHTGERALTSTAAAMGALGAATGVVQVIALSEMLHAATAAPIAWLDAAAPGPLAPVTRATSITGTVALGVQLAAPGLAGAVRVEVPR
jgi:3-oxoacyl-[acyl-carrier-protein] synthase II